MKRTIISCLAVLALLGTVSVNAVTKPNKVKKVASKRAWINMKGPSVISRTGGPYTYIVKVDQLPPDAKWVIMGNAGGSNVEFYASQPVDGYASLDVFGADFGTSTSAQIYLVGTQNDFGTIFGNKGVTINP